MPSRVLNHSYHFGMVLHCFSYLASTSNQSSTLVSLQDFVEHLASYAEGKNLRTEPNPGVGSAIIIYIREISVQECAARHVVVHGRHTRRYMIDMYVVHSAVAKRCLSSLRHEPDRPSKSARKYDADVDA